MEPALIKFQRDRRKIDGDQFFDTSYFLDALASLDLKLSLSQWVSDSPFSSIKASASTGLSELLLQDPFEPLSSHFEPL